MRQFWKRSENLEGDTRDRAILVLNSSSEESLCNFTKAMTPHVIFLESFQKCLEQVFIRAT